ncbi:MAG: NAD(P)-dependent oxidoreductase [Methylococcaceae bacterium]
MQTGLIGLGAMGTEMARNLAGAGYLKTVWNRTEGKAHQLAAELNVDCAKSPEQLAELCDAILICVSADQDVLDIVTRVSSTIKPGSIVVDMSTVSQQTAIEAAGILAARQASFLDAPVSGGVEGARKGSLVMMVGGDPAILESIQPLLETMTNNIVHIGKTGSGQGAKAVNQVMAAGINQAVTEALAFGEALDLPMAKVIDVIVGGAAGNWFLENRGLTMTQGTFHPGFKVELHLKDLLICQEMASKVSTATPLVEKTIKDYQRLINQQSAKEDISALYRLKKH